MKRKICIVCPIWKSGGIESFLYNTLSRMDLRDLQIDIVCERMGESIFTERLQSIGIRFRTLSGSTFRFVKNHRMFWKLSQKEQYSVLHLNAFQGMHLFYSFLAKRSGVVRRIVHSHNAGLRESRLRSFKLLLHKFYTAAFAGTGTDFWACSGQAAAFLFPENLLKQQGFTWIPNGIDTQRFRFDPAVRAELRRELGLDGKYVIGNVGRLCSQKNQRFLLPVLKEVLQKNGDCFLLLVGDGPDRNKIEEEAKMLGVSDNVLVYGVSTHVEALLCAMDVFALPSRFEGLPIAAVEAQASGLPVLYNICLAKEAAIIRKNFLTLPLRTGEWADAIARKMLNQQRENAAIEVDRAGFELSKLAQKLEKEYRSNNSVLHK